MSEEWVEFTLQLQPGAEPITGRLTGARADSSADGYTEFSGYTGLIAALEGTWGDPSRREEEGE